MNTTEFKSWFDGFSEAIGRDEIPTPSQWKRIQEEVSKMTPEVKHVPNVNTGPGPGYRNPPFDKWDRSLPPQISPYPTYPPNTLLCGTAQINNSMKYGEVVDLLAKNGTSFSEEVLKDETLTRR